MGRFLTDWIRSRDKKKWPLWRGGLYGEVFNKRILVNGSDVG